MSFHLSETVQHLSDAVIVTDANLHITEYAGSAEHVYGWTRDEVLGKHLASDFVTEFPDADADAVRAALANRRGARSTVRALRKDGAWVDLDLLAVPLFDTHAEFAGWLSVARDISERKRRGEHVRRQEAELRAIFDSSALGIGVAGLDGRWQRVNTALTEMLGYSAEELAGMTWLELTHPEDRSLHVEMYADLLRGGRASISLDKRYVRQDGSTLWSMTSVSCMRDAEGHVTGLVAMLKDISARKAAEQRALDAEARLARVIAGSNDGAVEWHIPTGRVDFSARFADMLGLPLTELEPTFDTRALLMHPDDEIRERPAIDALLRGELAQLVYETRARHADGHWVWLVVRARVVERDAEGHPVRVAGTMTDISERKRAEEATAAAEARYRSLFENLGLNVAVYDVARDADGHATDWILRECNAKGREWFAGGYSAAVGHGLIEMFGDAMRTYVERTEAFLRGLNGHRDVHIPMTDEYFRATAFALDDNTIVSASMDITQQKRTELALAAREAELDAVFNATDESVFLVDPDHTLLRLNEIAARRMGRPAAELVGRTLAELLPPDVLARRMPLIEQVRATGQPLEMEDERDGRWMVSRVHPVRPAQGGRCQLAVYSRDITGRKQMEDGMRTALAENERLVLELREALANVKTLSGFLPICAYCKKIRDDEGYWEQLEAYISTRTDARFTHGICEACARVHFPDVAIE